MIPSKNISHSTAGNCLQIYPSQKKKKDRATSLENLVGSFLPLGIQKSTPMTFAQGCQN